VQWLQPRIDRGGLTLVRDWPLPDLSARIALYRQQPVVAR
jgi:hypothetical protein